MTRPFIQKADEGANAMGAEPNKSGGGAGRNPHRTHRTNPEVPDPTSEFIPGQDLCNSSYRRVVRYAEFAKGNTKSLASKQPRIAAVYLTFLNSTTDG